MSDENRAIKDVLRRDALCNGPWALRILDEIERLENTLRERCGEVERLTPCGHLVAELASYHRLPMGIGERLTQFDAFVERARAALPLPVPREGICENCDGSGGDPLSTHDPDPESSFYGQPTEPCPVCDGTGRAAQPIPEQP